VNPFLRTLLFVAIALVAASPSLRGAPQEVAVVLDAPLSSPAAQALGDLEQALEAKGIRPLRRESPGEGWNIIVGVATDSELVQGVLASRDVAVPKAADSFCIRWTAPEPRRSLVIAGRDARGLSYALLEAAQAVELAPPGDDPLAKIQEAVESPYLAVRSITIHPCNHDVEASWYEDENFWRWWFAMLARNRYNNFTLTFSDQTNYLNPIYAYLVEAPDFPQVRVKGLSDAERAANLAMLKRIAELAQERGLDFTFGVWMQAPVPEYAGEVLVEGLPEGLKTADYAAQGLSQVLKACPAITGVQFRMNAEAGVPEEQQREFYTPLFHAVRNCGRPIRLDLRYKGLQPETTQSAIDTGLEVTVSTKFWAEHLGLPYHPTVADRNYRESRYSFGSMLARPRDYRVVYRLWTAGSQRLLLWGDPEYAARFARSCLLGGGEGFEVFAPLTNKGHGNDPGAWRIFARQSDEHFTWEQERYWFFYLAFGRIGYDPNCGAEVWRRELRNRFGDAAPEMERAYAHGSRILPLLSATRLPSASEWRWWPEMDTAGRLRQYMHIQPADTAQFYAIRSWQRTPDWPWEAWDENITGYAEDAVAGRLQGKTTPAEVAQMLRGLAEATESNLSAAEAKIATSSAEFRATQMDLRVLAHLARYHAEKTTAATHLAFFELTGETGRLPEALRHTRTAADQWRSIVQLTDGSYHDDLVFGIRKGTPRSRYGLHHSGHWKDRLGEIEEDVKWLERLAKEHGGEGKPFTRLPGETPRSVAPHVEHTPVEAAAPGKDVMISIRVPDAQTLDRVHLNYRPLNQTEEWKQMPMQPHDGGEFRAIIPGEVVSERFDLQYYFELSQPGGAGWLWPSWMERTPYHVITTNRLAP
jgi:hypothetical protein